MKLLAIETSTVACSAALLVGDEIEERYVIAPRRHAELLLPMIDELLAAAGLTVSQLDGLAFGRGPGAFTGLRIASGVAQGIAFGAQLPVAPVSTLAALAQGVAGRHQRVLAVMDARIGEVYRGVYETDSDGIMRERAAECVCAPDRVPLPDSGDWFGAGDGWRSYDGILRERLGARIVGTDPDRYPRARDVAVLGKVATARDETVPAERAIPVYLRERVATAR